jgi:two-component system NarL family sensor kinase
MIRSLIILWMVFGGMTVHAQNSLLDQIEALKVELKSKTEKADKAKLYGDLSWYYNSVNLDSAFYYGTQALEMARELKDRKLIAQSLSDMGSIYFIKGDVDESLEHYQEALHIREEDKDEEGISSINFKLGAVYYRKMELEKSMDYYLKALKFYEQVNNESVIANLYSNIAVTYTALRNYPKALEFLNKSEQFFSERNMDQQLANTLLSIGNVYIFTKDTTKGIAYYERAIVEGKKAGVFNVEASAYNNIGMILTEQGRHQEAVRYINKSIEIREREKLESDAASSNLTLAINYIRLRNFSKAKPLLMNSLQHFQSTGYREKIGLVYYQLIPTYAGLGQMDSMFYYMDSFVKNTAEELDEKVIEVTSELETKYQTEKKEQQIELLNQESAIQKLQLRNRTLFLVVVIFLLVGGALLAYLLFRQRQLKEEARIQEEIRKQQEATTKAVLDAEEKERRRIAGDLHDGVGQLLSAALLNLKQFSKGLVSSESIKTDTVEDAIKMVEDSYDEMRSISHQMMPNALVKFGLVSAVREFVNKIDGNVIKISLGVSGLDERLESQKETVLYRVIQECVNNVIKHAKATQMSIQLTYDESGTSLAIEDNGIGFDASAIDWESSNGLGLKNMKDRLELLNGEIEIDSRPGKGTSITIFVP